jgi:peptidoglycan/LPS O-acetylase OafA/YrhL
METMSPVLLGVSLLIPFMVALALHRFIENRLRRKRRGPNSEFAKRASYCSRGKDGWERGILGFTFGEF